MDYLLHEQWGGEVQDAKKTAANPDDDLMCWAAAASNVLLWAGWGNIPDESFNDSSDIFAYFQDHWLDTVGSPANAWKWWFDGQPIADVTSPGGGFWGDHQFDLNYQVEWNRADAAQAIKQYCSQGCGIV